jgi:hypothetical protein
LGWERWGFGVGLGPDFELLRLTRGWLLTRCS